MNSEFLRRTIFLGVIAWLSVCLLVVGLVPQLCSDLSPLWLVHGLLGLASSLGLAEVVKSDQRRHDAHIAGLRRSRRDPLTGLSTRWEFDRLINIMIGDAQSHGLPMSLILIDLDGLNGFNQTAGYAAGDDLLVQASESIIAATRGADLVARYGEDEFAVVLADVEHDLCRQIMLRIRCQVGASLTEQLGQPVTLCVGAATLLPDDSSESVLQRAELALFRAKSTGPGEVCLHDFSGPELLPQRGPCAEAGSAGQ